MGTIKDLIGITEVAVLIGKSSRQTQRLAEQGALPVFMKMPGKTGAFLFDRTEINELAS